ncbi:MAG: PLP-dependent aminotransferase family protein [Bacteroidales bacterium]
MKSDLNSKLSFNALNMRRSPARNILAGLNQKELISFAGGYPNPDTFPVDDLKIITEEVLNENGAKALQYGPTEGDPALREAIAARYRTKGVAADASNIVITTSSQQAIDLCSRIFLNREDRLICSLPTYFGALQSFWFYGGVPTGIASESDLETTVIDLINKGQKTKFIYTVPDFQNPSGITLSLEDRKRMVQIAREYDLIIIEDSPYRDLRYEGKEIPALISLDRDRVIHLGTFSKTLAPGFRLGWVIANNEVLNRIVVAKQSADLCASVFDQAIAARYLEKGLFDRNLEKTVYQYRMKRDLMIGCFSRYMPEGVKWTTPEGGLFLFVTLPDGVSATEILKETLKLNLAFVPGEIFYCDGGGQNTMRINFSYMDLNRIERGVEILSSVIKTFLK